MSRLAAILLGFGLLSACTGDRARQKSVAPSDDVLVEHDAGLQETHYTVAAGNCRIIWTVPANEVNRGGIRHRPDCGLPLAEQAPLIRKLLRKVLASDPLAREIHTLGWGRLYPDGARDLTMPARLALAALRSPEWDAARGAPRGGNINEWVRKLANESRIYDELRPVFSESGLEIEISSVEKVLVSPAGALPFFEKLREAGTREQDKVPFDCQTWFSVRRAAAVQP